MIAYGKAEDGNPNPDNTHDHVLQLKYQRGVLGVSVQESTPALVGELLGNPVDVETGEAARNCF